MGAKADRPQPICTRVAKGRGERKGLRLFLPNGTLVDILRMDKLHPAFVG